MAIAFDATNSSRNVNSTSMTHNHTCSGSNRVLYVGFNPRGGSFADTITYNGVAMTELTQQAYSFGQAGIQLFRLVNPDTGSNAIVATCSISNTEMNMVSVSYTGVHQTTPDGTPASAFADADNGPMTVNVASVNSGELVIDYVGPFFPLTAPTTTQTIRGVLDDTASSGAYNGMSEKSATGTVTMSWTLTTTPKDWAIIAVAVKPASASSTSPPMFRGH